MVGDRLPVFLWMAANKSLIWGQWDCGLWQADYYTFATGKPDPAAHLRGKYQTREECLALCGPLGFPRMIQRVADGAGLQRTQTPRRGDVGIIRAGNVAVGAILATNFWAFLHERGGLSSINVNEPNLRLLAAWTI